MATLSRGQRWAIGVGLLLTLPIFAAGLYNDDWVHLALRRGMATGFSSSPLRLYEFTRPDGDAATLAWRGVLPWWTSAGLHLRFFRPLSSLLVSLDHAVGQGSALFGHAHAMLWFAALLGLAAWVYARLLPARAASWATFAYALAGYHAVPTLWISSRNGLSSATLGLAAFALHLRARFAGRVASPAALGLFALGLLCGETALGAAAFVGAWELLGRDEPLPARSRAVAPWAALTACYLGVYAALGFGGGGGGGYVDPLRETGRFLANYPARLGALCADALLGLPADLTNVAPRAMSTLGLLGALALGGLLLGLRAGRSLRDEAHTRAARALTLGALLAATPGTAAVLGGRILPLAGVGFAGLLGLVLSERWAQRKAGFSARSAWWALAATAGLSVVLLGPAWRVLQPLAMRGVSSAQSRLAAEAEWGCDETGDAFTLVSSDPSIGMYGGPLVLLGGRHARSGQVLSMVPARHRLTRVGEQSVELEPLGGARFFDSFLEQIYRSPRERMPVGTSLRTRGLTVTVVAERDGLPTRVRYDFARPLAEPGVCLMEWRGARLRRVTLPPVGSSRELEHELGPMGF